jgi:phage/plasmid-like protein (TIGR03299 family)
VRDNPESGKVEALAYVGGGYRAVQLEEAFAVAAELESLGATVETAGSIRGGRQAFMTLHTAKGFVLDPNGAADRVQGYLNLRTSHDGSVANEAVSSLVRIVCANTFDMVTAENGKRAYRVRHTAKVHERLAAAQASLAIANGHLESFAALADKLYRVPMNNGEFIELANIIYPEPESKRGNTLWTKKLDLLDDLFTGAGDVEYTLGNVENNAWKGLNALTERIDWHRKARGGDGSSLLIAQAGFTQNITVEKQAILNSVVAWAKDKAPAVFA